MLRLEANPFPYFWLLENHFLHPIRTRYRSRVALLWARRKETPVRRRREARYTRKTGGQRREKDRLCRGCRRRRGTCQSLWPAAGDQRRDRLGSDHFYGYRRRPYLWPGKRRSRCRQRVAKI